MDVIMEMLAYVFLALGVLVGYKGGALYKRIKGAEPDEQQLALLKIGGLIIVIIGAILIFYIR
ncbi:MAG: hypothetical protein GX066_04110 [Clostridiaceae bacterium]|nr:hypothetical protein [Clostridiaceae bacterium]